MRRTMPAYSSMLLRRLGDNTYLRAVGRLATSSGDPMTIPDSPQSQQTVHLRVLAVPAIRTVYPALHASG